MKSWFLVLSSFLMEAIIYHLCPLIIEAESYLGFYYHSVQTMGLNYEIDVLEINQVLLVVTINSAFSAFLMR
jgi:hypothetical protein